MEKTPGSRTANDNAFTLLRPRSEENTERS